MRVSRTHRRLAPDLPPWLPGADRALLSFWICPGMCQRKACAMQISVQAFAFPRLFSVCANSELYITLNSYEFTEEMMKSLNMLINS